jgi:hypothetical protein
MVKINDIDVPEITSVLNEYTTDLNGVFTKADLARKVNSLMKPMGFYSGNPAGQATIMVIQIIKMYFKDTDIKTWKTIKIEL